MSWRLVIPPGDPSASAERGYRRSVCAFHGSVEHHFPITRESANRVGILWASHIVVPGSSLVSCRSLLSRRSPPLLVGLWPRR